MKNLIIHSLFITGALLLTSPTNLAAQGNSNNNPGRGNGGPGNSGNAPGHSKSTGVPIDGGTGFLLAAGAAYGLKKLKDYRNRNQNSV